MDKDLKTIIKKLDELLSLMAVQSDKIDEVKKSREHKLAVFNPVKGGKRVK